MINTDSLKTAAQSAAIAAILGAIVLAVPEANAAFRTSGNGGTLCKAASGPGADVFYFDNRYAQNTSAAVQYLSCGFIDASTIGINSAISMYLGYGNPTGAPAAFTCVVQAGTEGLSTVNSATLNAIAAPGTYDLFALTASSIPKLPVRPDPLVGYTASCAVPAQGKITLVQMDLL